MPTAASHSSPKLFRPALLAAASSYVFIVWITTGGASAQAQSDAPSRATPISNVVHLSASATQEVAQDLLTISLSTTRDGSDAAGVQTQLKQAIDAALAAAKAQAATGAMDVRTGAFSLFPRYDRSGRITGWQGSAELVLEGKDFARISGTAGRLQGLAVQGINFSLSRTARQALEGDVQARAIAEFRTKAADVAKQFGFASYTLREVHVGSADASPPPRPRLLAMEAKVAASADMAVPVEAGKANVTVNVSGSVILGR